jgi:hypothetical protein
MAMHPGNDKRLKIIVVSKGKAIVLEQDRLQTCLCSVVGCHLGVLSLDLPPFSLPCQMTLSKLSCAKGGHGPGWPMGSSASASTL